MRLGSRTFFAGPELHRIAARALAACGRDDEAVDQVRCAAREARQLGSPALELRALVEAVRAGVGEADVRARLAELTELLDSDDDGDLADARALLAELN
jgi:hypothetical protein